MMQIFADGKLVLDSRLEEYAPQALRVTAVLSKGGTAEITLPRTHPSYGLFQPYKTVVEIYRHQELIFRGRPLTIAEDLYGSRTITCEGERCFLRDGIMRPYLYQDAPDKIFEAVIAAYNSQVDAAKQFALGAVTVTDSNNYVRLESGSAETCLATIDKLVERCGGYVTFSTADDGKRTIGWYATLNGSCRQAIKITENLLDFARSTANTDLATVIIPYGARDAETGERLTIRTVNNGVDYIEDAEAIALRGRIVKAMYWDDVTLPENLLTKAQAALSGARLLITTLRLNVIDLSNIDPEADALNIGCLIPVELPALGVNADFLLVEREYDLLEPSQDSIVLGMDISTLTGAQASADRKNSDSINRIEREAKSDYQKNKEQISGTETRLSSLIAQSSELISSEVSKQQQTIDTLRQELTRLEQDATRISAVVRSIEENGVSKVTTETGAVLDKDGLHVSRSGEEMETRIDFSGVHVERGTVSILEAAAGGVNAENITVRKYLNVPNSRFEAYANARDAKRTACFII